MLTATLAATFAGSVWAASAAVATPAVLPDDMSMGSPTAKIQVIEYASLACPHCGHFNETIFPSLKAKYIDTGKVRYTLKEMLTEPVTVAAAGFLIARCAGPSKYFIVVDQVFRSQPRWTSGNIKPIFQEIAAANGVDEAHFNACLQDQPGVDAIAGRAKRASEQDGVDSTPTLFINGKKLATVPQTPDELDAAIAAAVKAPAAKPGAKKSPAKKGGR
ncbi:MAG TPA: DsbA family protein [Phenylobacterium sp.]|nr:DsbA family protein [Phenylobacterium sp.]